MPFPATPKTSLTVLGNLDFSYTDELILNKYSKYGPALRTPSCMQHSYLLSIDFKITSLTDWIVQLKILSVIPVCKTGRKMNHDGVEISKTRIKL